MLTDTDAALCWEIIKFQSLPIGTEEKHRYTEREPESTELQDEVLIARVSLNLCYWLMPMCQPNKPVLDHAFSDDRKSFHMKLKGVCAARCSHLDVVTPEEMKDT